MTGGLLKRPALVVGLVAAAVNLPALIPGFIHDDHRIIEQNELVRDLSRAGEIFTHGYWSVGAASVPNLYRPFTILSFALNHAVNGLHPSGYRLVNLALHVLCALLVLALGRRLFGATGPEGRSRPDRLLDPALLGALLFAVHPVHTEVLGLVVGRAELLAAAGCLGGVLAFLAGRDRAAGPGERSPGSLYVLSVGCLVLGMLSKENASIGPFLVLLADRLLVPGRMAWRFHALSLAALLLCLGLRVAAIGGLNPPGFVHYVDNPIAHLPFVPGRLTALGVIARYAFLLVAPWRLSIDYSYKAIRPIETPLDPLALAGALIVVSWAALLAVSLRRSKRTAFALGWIGLAMAPVANLLVPIGTVMAERLLYLPSAGVALLAGAVVTRLRDGRAARDQTPEPGRTAPRAVPVLAGVVLAAFAGRSALRLRDWRDDATIFRKALQVAPGSVRALFNHGSNLEQEGDEAAAIRSYQEAIAIWPPFADAHYNLGGLFARQKRWPEAVEEYRLALRDQPGNVPYLVNLGHALGAAGKSGEAREVLERAVALDPASDRAHTNLGAACLALGDAPAAIRAYEASVRIDPANADYLRNLGLALGEAGDAGGAVAAYRRGLALRPGDPDLLFALGVSLLKTGDSASALEALRQAVRAWPDHPVVHYHLGRALERGGSLEEAATEYRAAVRMAPSAPAPLVALGLLLARTGDRAGARRALEGAAALDSGGSFMDAEARRVLASLRARRRRRRSARAGPGRARLRDRSAGRAAPRRRRGRRGRS